MEFLVGKVKERGASAPKFVMDCASFAASIVTMLAG